MSRKYYRGGSLINLINDYTPDKEIIIGKFYDGKILYQQIKVFNNVKPENQSSLNHGISNVDTIFIEKIMLNEKTTNFTICFPTISGSASILGARVNGTQITFTGNDYWLNTVNRDIIVVLRYTKL